MIAESEEVCVEDLIDEIAMGPFGSNIKTDCFVNSGIPVFNGSNLTGFETNDTALRYVTPEKANSLGNALASRGDIVITHRGTLGQVAMVPYDSKYPRYVISQSQFRIRCNDKVLPKFFVYYFHTREGQWRLLSNKTQTGVPALGRPTSTFRKLSMPLPTFEKQAKIVQVIDTIQEKIKNNTKLNGYLEELLLAKYDKLFPVNADFTGILSDVGTVIGGATPSKKRSEYYCSNGIGWITPRDLSNTSDKFIAHGADDITDEGYASCSAKLLPKGSVLFSSRAPIGYIAIATDAVATNQGFKSIVPKEEIGTAFVYCFLVRNKQRIADMGAGTTFPEVSGKMMKSVELAVPKQTLCAEFNFFAGPILKQQEALERENRELAALRDALLPKLMSGEIDVSQVDLTQLNSHLAWHLTRFSNQLG